MAILRMYHLRGEVQGRARALYWLTSLVDEPIDWSQYEEWESYLSIDLCGFY